MRRSSIVLALLAIAALSTSARAADVALKSSWDGFGEGSWVLQKTTTQNVNGAEKSETISESKYTLKKVADKAYTLKIETKIGAEWIAQDIDLPRIAEPSTEKPAEAKVEDLGTEELTVDGEEIECKKVKSTVAGTVTVTWSDETSGSVKSETKGPDGETTVEVTKWKAIVKIKGKDVECRVEKTTHKSAQVEMTASTWKADPAIPTQTGYVRSESSMKIVGMGTTNDVTEVTDFEKK